MPTVPDNQTYDDLIINVIELIKLINKRLGAVNPNAAHTLASKIVSLDAKVDKLSSSLSNLASEISSLNASVQEMAELCRKSSLASSKDYGPVLKAKTVARFQPSSVAKTVGRPATSTKAGGAGKTGGSKTTLEIKFGAKTVSTARLIPDSDDDDTPTLAARFSVKQSTITSATQSEAFEDRKPSVSELDQFLFNLDTGASSLPVRFTTVRGKRVPVVQLESDDEGECTTERVSTDLGTATKDEAAVENDMGGGADVENNMGEHHGESEGEGSENEGEGREGTGEPVAKKGKKTQANPQPRSSSRQHERKRKAELSNRSAKLAKKIV